MKSLAKAKDAEEMVARLESVKPDSARRWGRMTAHQMVCHLSDGFRMYMDLKKVKKAGKKYAAGVVRWAALWAPIPWPRGFRTVAELDQEAEGTPPEEFARDVGELKGLVERFRRRPRDYEFQPHPFFGQMTEKEWMRLAYRHMDHHLRQFGA